MSDLTLKKCPFCGSPGKLQCEYDEDDGESWFVECLRCSVSSPQRYSLKEDARPLVVEAWNTRTAPDKDAAVRLANLSKQLLDDATAEAKTLRDALSLLVADVAQYEAWQRPCYALEVARAALQSTRLKAAGAAPGSSGDQR